MKFKPRDKVTHVPTWTAGDLTHPDCLPGVVVEIEDGGQIAKVQFVVKRPPSIKCPQRVRVSELVERR